MKQSLLLVVLIAGGLTACSKSDQAVSKTEVDSAIPITTAVVKSVPLDRTLQVVGTLFAKDESTLSAEVDGQVEKTMAEFGDRVTAGQEIARIDTTTYDAQVKQAAANLAKAKATANNTGQDLKRVQELRKSGISSDADLDKATADAEQARSVVKASEAEQAIAALHLEKSRVSVPYDSAIADRIATAGDYVKVGTPLFRIIHDGVLKYIVQAPERYVGDVKKEQLVVFTVDAYPTNQFTGKVFLISPQVNTATRAFAFGALVQNPDRKLRANTFARGEVIFERDVPTPMVPIDAVLSLAGVSRVFVVENGVAHARTVEAGRIRDGWQEIKSGLKAGETVVLTGSAKLFEGSKVRVKDAAHE